MRGMPASPAICSGVDSPVFPWAAGGASFMEEDDIRIEIGKLGGHQRSAALPLPRIAKDVPHRDAQATRRLIRGAAPTARRKMTWGWIPACAGMTDQFALPRVFVVQGCRPIVPQPAPGCGANSTGSNPEAAVDAEGRATLGYATTTTRCGGAQMRQPAGVGSRPKIWRGVMTGVSGKPGCVRVVLEDLDPAPLKLRDRPWDR